MVYKAPSDLTPVTNVLFIHASYDALAKHPYPFPVITPYNKKAPEGAFDHNVINANS
ncbi:hypothetical protein [Neptunomonas antarctica]|uniref:hypothetical protein n=1 Tax=Neptunomonas antarctica TaxID=619304 RepID=UPI0012E31081|nr:hypothetical protein [Neptunomonas antarctica]